MRKFLKMLTSRLVIVSLLIFLQFVLIAFMFLLPGRYFWVYYAATIVVGFAVCIRIITRRGNPGYKIGWIILVLVLPPFGVAVYFIFHGNSVSEKTKRKMAGINGAMARAISQDTGRKEVVFDDPEARKQSDYIKFSAHNPPYSGVRATYYPTGEAMYDAFLSALRGAKKYIFLEYFILAKGTMWDDVHAILKEKAAEGVDVRII